MTSESWWRRGWRLLGGVSVPPARRTWRSGEGIDAASIGGGPDEPGGGADIARDFGPFEDPLAREDESDREH